MLGKNNLALEYEFGDKFKNVTKQKTELKNSSAFKQNIKWKDNNINLKFVQMN